MNIYRYIQLYTGGEKMKIIVSNKSRIPIYEQIVNRIKDEIENERVQKDEILPSIRVLAKELRVSVITTKKAYEELEKEGYVYTVKGKGIFVSEANREFIKDDKLRRIEDNLLKIIYEYKKLDLEYKEFGEMVEILWNEGESNGKCIRNEGDK